MTLPEVNLYYLLLGLKECGIESIRINQLLFFATRYTTDEVNSMPRVMKDLGMITIIDGIVFVISDNEYAIAQYDSYCNDFFKELNQLTYEYRALQKAIVG